MIHARGIRAIVVKELRETIGFVLLAPIVAYLVVATRERYQAYGVPFVTDDFVYILGVACWVLAIALGLRQSAWEGIRGTYSFLLHRPAPARTIFATKMATGVIVVQLIAGLAIFARSVWAATPGTHPSPFEWSMTEHAWCVWLGLPVAYLGAFLSGLRSARWYGTRLLPGLAGSMLFVLLAQFTWPYALAGSLLLSAALTGLVFHLAASSDFA